MEENTLSISNFQCLINASINEMVTILGYTKEEANEMMYAFLNDKDGVVELPF